MEIGPDLLKKIIQLLRKDNSFLITKTMERLIEISLDGNVEVYFKLDSDNEEIEFKKWVSNTYLNYIYHRKMKPK